MLRLSPLVLLLTAVVACTSPPHRAAAAPALQMRHLATPIVLEVVVSKPRLDPPLPPATGPAKCPDGFAALSGPDADPSLCYQQLGAPMTITYAAISPLTSEREPYELGVMLRTGDQAAFQAIIARAKSYRLALIVAGQAWDIDEIRSPPPTHAFSFLLSTRQQADQLLRLLEQPR